jgi:spore maturation protein CgeB
VRIGIVGPAGTDLFASNVIDALGAMGHAVTPLGPAATHHPGTWRGARIAGLLAEQARQLLPRLDERLQRRIIRSAAAAGCRVVLSLDARLLPSTVAQLRRDGARVALWFPDALVNLGRAAMLLAPYDALFFKEPHLVERLAATTALPVYYLPEACNPRLHRPLVAAGTHPHLVLAGNIYPSRVRLLERLAAKGIPVRTYGGALPRWLGDTPVRDMHTARVVLGEEKARIFRSAAGVLNNLHPAEVAGVNARLFEAAGAGAAVLTEYRPTVPGLFAVGSEVLTFRDLAELIGQAERLLTEPGLTARLGDAAASRAHRDHTYRSRLETIIERVS